MPAITSTMARSALPLMGMLLALAACAHAAQASQACTAKVSTASDAAAKADWIIEGKVDMVGSLRTEGLTVTLSDTNVIKGKGANNGGSDTVNIDPAAGARFQG